MLYFVDRYSILFAPVWTPDFWMAPYY